MSNDGATLLGPIVHDDPEDDSTVMMSWDQLVAAIEKPLHEAGKKLAAYARGIRAVLLDCEFFIEYTDVHEAIGEINRENYATIDRLYLLNVEHRGQLTRVW